MGVKQGSPWVWVWETHIWLLMPTMLRGPHGARVEHGVPAGQYCSAICLLGASEGLQGLSVGDPGEVPFNVI